VTFVKAHNFEEKRGEKANMVIKELPLKEGATLISNAVNFLTFQTDDDVNIRHEY
jgi:hypothetical protein